MAGDYDAGEALEQIRLLLAQRPPLSFRDQCAIAAMPLVRLDFTGVWDAAELAREAFDLADAVEAERQKRGGQ